MSYQSFYYITGASPKLIAGSLSGYCVDNEILVLSMTGAGLYSSHTAFRFNHIVSGASKCFQMRATYGSVSGGVTTVIMMLES